MSRTEHQGANMEIKFWKVGCADSITIRYKDDSDVYRNIFIDGGYAGTYRSSIKKELQAIEAREEKVDLWVVTHTDQDHIGAVESFIKDTYFAGKQSIVQQYWFNWSSYEIVLPSAEISVSQGIKLRDHILKMGTDHVKDIVAGQDIQYAGLRFSILSPDAERLVKSKKKWSQKEFEMMVSAEASDYTCTIEALQQKVMAEDMDVWNGGSIAFILHNGDDKMLLLADSHPGAIVESLRKLGYSRENKLKVSFVKLSHHGSARNLNVELLGMMDCNRFVILGNGIANKLPNKAALVSILTHPGRNYAETIEFLFSDDTPALKSIFAVDGNTDQFNFRCGYNNEDFLSIKM